MCVTPYHAPYEISDSPSVGDGKVLTQHGHKLLDASILHLVKKTRIKINKAKAMFTGRSPRHTQVGHPEGTKQKPGVDIRVKGMGHVM
jgi:hypothetical protein